MKIIKFNKNYLKLSQNIFTTIRQKSQWQIESTEILCQPKTWNSFTAKIIKVEPIKIEDITDALAKRDADMSKDELLKTLKKIYWYVADLNLNLLTIQKTESDKMLL